MFRPTSDGAGRYVRLDECGLAVEVDWHGGNGSPADPWRCTVTVRNDGSVAFEGVVRIDIPIRADGEPRFFLPGFMYGRNRGEAPLRTATKFPRLRDRSELPASSCDDSRRQAVQSMCIGRDPFPCRRCGVQPYLLTAVMGCWSDMRHVMNCLSSSMRDSAACCRRLESCPATTTPRWA